MKDLKQRRTYRRLCILLHKLYEINKKHKNYSFNISEKNSGIYGDGSKWLNGVFYFNENDLKIACIDCTTDHEIVFIISDINENNLLKLSLFRNSYHGTIQFYSLTTFKTAKSAYKFFIKAEKTVDKELKKYYNLDIQNENLHDDFENLIGAF